MAELAYASKRLRTVYRRKKDKADITTTNRASEIDAYMGDVGRHPLIDREEEIRLARLVQAGDEEARERLITANLRFVIQVAASFQNRGLSMGDLVQEGNAGLVRAAEKFNPDAGVKFISYAVWWIRQSIQHALATHGRVVRIPLNRASDLMHIHYERNHLRQALGREPTTAEIAERVKLTPEVVEALEPLNAGAVRLDAPVVDDADTALVDRYVCEQVEDLRDVPLGERPLRDVLEMALADLPEREAFVLRHYFGLGTDEPKTLEEVGRLIGVTRERTRQIREKALERLRANETALLLLDD